MEGLHVMSNERRDALYLAVRSCGTTANVERVVQVAAKFHDFLTDKTDATRIVLNLTSPDIDAAELGRAVQRALRALERREGR